MRRCCSGRRTDLRGRVKGCVSARRLYLGLSAQVEKAVIALRLLRARAARSTDARALTPLLCNTAGRREPRLGQFCGFCSRNGGEAHVLVRPMMPALAVA